MSKIGKLKFNAYFVSIIFLLFLFSGCADTPYSRSDRARAEEYAQRILRASYFMNFIIDDTTFDNETRVFRILATSLDGQHERQISLRVDGERVFVVR